jgi:hypothetical protein
MKTELDPKLAWGAIALLVVAVALGYYFFFRTPSGELSAEEAGLGKPVNPNELPPGVTPPPWEQPASTSQQGNPPTASTNPQ